MSFSILMEKALEIVLEKTLYNGLIGERGWSVIWLV